MRIAFYTLGCKVNQTETGAMSDFLKKRGHVIVSPEEPCDAIVINTCAVTAVSSQKSRQAIRRLRGRHPGARVAVCGCLPETGGLSGIEGIDLIGGPDNRLNFVLSLERQDAVRKPQAVSSERVFEPLPASTPDGRTRAFLKVQDGCENYCSYCIIPSARGLCRSLPLDMAVEQAKDACDRGFKELVLTGIEISSYIPSLIELIERVCVGVPSVRIRLGSLEPGIIDKEFAGRISKLDNLCPHFHLSLQSGCDDTLRRMNRRYTVARYREAVSLLREVLPLCSVTTDLICGFPGETDGEWEKTLAFIEDIGFSSIHIFPYSRRPGTPAASYPDQIPNTVKRERANQAQTVARRGAQNYRNSLIGETLHVLFETENEGHAENYQRVRVDGKNQKNELRAVKITGAQDDVLLGGVT